MTEKMEEEKRISAIEARLAGIEEILKILLHQISGSCTELGLHVNKEVKNAQR